MKFQCDRCKTKYSIGEDKVRGKVLKIRCKNCSAVITVREGQAVTGSGDKGSVVGRAPTADQPNAAPNGSHGKGGGKSQAPTLEAAFDRAMARPSGAMAAQPAPASAGKLSARDRTQPSAPDEGAFDVDDGASTKLAPVPVPDLRDSDEVEWFVSIDGEQEGPFTLAEAQQRVSRKKPDEELHAWQEGFEDWLPVERVPELAPHLPQEKRPMRASAPPIPEAASSANSGRVGLAAKGGGSAPVKSGAAGGKDKDADAGSPLSLSALSAAAPGAEGGGAADGGDFDFDIGEASRVVKLPMLVPGPRGDAAGAGARAGQSLPGMAAARGTGGQAVVGPGIVGDDVNPSAAVLIPPPRRKKHGALFYAGGGLFVVVLGVLLVVLLQGGTSSGGTFTGENPTSQFVAGFYEKDPEMTPIIPALPPPEPKDEGGKKPGGGIRRPVPKQPGGVSGTNPGTTGGSGRGTEEFGDPLNPGGLAQRDAEEVLEAQSRFGAGLKWCWERQLKVNPDLKGRGMRLDVTITITAAGGVRGVNVAGSDRDLRECVRQKVATWSFKAAREDFTTQFPVVFN